ncbi:MAG TPA: transcription termination/antitermination NusG family protein [Ktedonobacteraceae bacterium]|nr:transcription termination/antitermination NusG family protein [Ktedonobacteraceae bacterium]
MIDNASNDEKIAQAAWYLVRCKPEKEFYAMHALKQIMHLETFVPQYNEGRRSPVRPVPFFPGYLFVRADLRVVAVSEISTCPGVLCLVRFGAEPLCVAQEIIDEIADRLRNLQEPAEPLVRGDRVRMKGGPLQGLAMVFAETVEAGKRVNVLLEFLGGTRMLCVDPMELEHLANEIQVNERRRRMRSTRGKGRRIKEPGRVASAEAVSQEIWHE